MNYLRKFLSKSYWVDPKIVKLISDNIHDLF